MTEKLALARELSKLKPEIEYLRSQTETYQSLLTEKLSLQRQLSTAQVELEMEKRGAQRALAMQERFTEKDGRLEDQLEELRNQLATERRAREKVERDAQKESASWEGRKAILEGKLDAFRNKLRTTKEQLKQTEEELQKAQVSVKTLASRARPSGYYDKPATNPRKRPATHIDMDATIGTPGDLPPAKRGKRGSTLPGDKSTFSITPFLNRTASVAPDTPREENGVENEIEHNEEVSAPAEPPIKPPNAIPAPSSVVGQKPNVAKKASTVKSTGDRDSLTTAKTGKSNIKAPPSRKRSVFPPLENVAEEQNDENEPPAEIAGEDPSRNGVDLESHLPPPIGDVEPKKRKHKLLGSGLGKTLFDDDDGEAAKAGTRVPIGAARVFGVLGRGALAGPKGNLRRGLGTSVDSSKVFSPLKKDMRVSTEG